MGEVLLATCAALPHGEPGAEVLDAALAARGVRARWAVWDDPGVDWSAADLVAVRSTWDYIGRYDAFLAWARSVADATLLNGADVFDWNHDKRYLLDLARDGVPVVPTRLVDDAAAGAAAVRELGTAVLKPRVGAGGAGLVVVTDPADERLGRPVGGHRGTPTVGGPWVAQPLVASIHSHGETSVFVVDGRARVQVGKRPAPGEVRVHGRFGGSSVAVPLGEEAVVLATTAVQVAGDRFGRALDYARVDMVRHGGALVVSELELIEPGLYLDVTPDAAGPFAELVADRA